MDDKFTKSQNNSLNMSNVSMSSLTEETSSNFAKILEDLDITGEITDKKHPLVTSLTKLGRKLDKSKIKYSYTNAQTSWTEFKHEDKIYLFRITNKIDKKIEELIRKEYKIHEKNEELNYISPEFVCFYFSKFFNFSVFIIKDSDYSTLDEILENKKLDSDIEFTKEDLLLASSSTIENLYQDPIYYICPYLTPYNLIYTSFSGKEYFLVSEIYLETDSPEKEIEIELCNKDLNDWRVPEFIKNKAKLNFSSNIYCLGNIFYKIIFNENPKKPLKIEEHSVYKELIDKCMNRCTIEEIRNYIQENDFEEKEKEMSIKQNLEKENLKKEFMQLIDEENKLNNKNDNINIENRIKNIDEKGNEEDNKEQIINLNEIKNDNNIILNKNEIKEIQNTIINNEDKILKFDEKNNNIKDEIIENNLNNNNKISNSEKNNFNDKNDTTLLIDSKKNNYKNNNLIDNIDYNENIRNEKNFNVTNDNNIGGDNLSNNQNKDEVNEYQLDANKNTIVIGKENNIDNKNNYVIIENNKKNSNAEKLNLSHENKNEINFNINNRKKNGDINIIFKNNQSDENTEKIIEDIKNKDKEIQSNNLQYL